MSTDANWKKLWLSAKCMEMKCIAERKRWREVYSFIFAACSLFVYLASVYHVIVGTEDTRSMLQISLAACTTILIVTGLLCYDTSMERFYNTNAYRIINAINFKKVDYATFDKFHSELSKYDPTSTTEYAVATYRDEVYKTDAWASLSKSLKLSSQ